LNQLSEVEKDVEERIINVNKIYENEEEFDTESDS